MAMKIAILGSGNVGAVLGRRWHEAGHEVTFGSRDPQSPRTRATVAPAGGRATGVAAAAVAAEVAVLAVPWAAVRQTLAAAGPLEGKVLLDCTNPLGPGLEGLEVGPATSGGEEVARLAPAARVVKIFNTTGAGNMADPRYGGQAVSMLHAGDDEAAKRTAARLARDLGFEPIDAGPLRAARLLESLALLWITLAYRRGLGADFALQVLRRPGVSR
jgi:NADPH-dependent F420 reductase